MVHEFDIHVVQLSDVTKHWWQLALLSLDLAAVFIGILYIGSKLILKIRCSLRLKSRENTLEQLALKVRTYFEALDTTPVAPRVSEKSNTQKPTSFRVYLGAFDNVASDSQLRILADCDLVILDPLQHGANHAITSTPRSRLIARFILGRLDLETLLGAAQHDSGIKDFTIFAFDHILDLVSAYFPTPSGRNRGFTGIVLANWEIFFSVATLHELSKELSKRALDVYLETESPHFLHELDAVAQESITGLVIRNGLLWPNGERKDCFDLDKMRPTTKSFMAQEFLRPFTTMVWEELDNNAVIPIAVLKRTYAWSRFHSTLSWIAPSYALFDAEAVVPQVEPLSAFDWLKESSVVQLHNLWKNNQTVSSASLNRQAFVPINKFIPALSTMWKDNICNSCGSSGATDDPESASHEPEWIALHSSKKFDTLSASEAGFKYDGQGCFPIGISITVEDFVQVVQSQRRLRRLELLEEIAPNVLEEFSIVLRDFVRSESLTQSTDNSKIDQIQDVILDLSRNLTGTLDSGINNVHVYQGLDTGFHSTGEKRFWGVYSIHASRDTDIYISSKSEDVIGTILHTYLSSRGCPRRHCLEAEFALAEWSGSLSPSRLVTKRVQQDIESLTPSESLILLQQLTFYDSSPDNSVVKGVREEVEAQLIENPAKGHLKSISVMNYLNGLIDAEGLISAVIDSHCQQGLRHPSRSACLRLFFEVEEAIQKILRDRRVADLDLITVTLLESMKYSCTDTATDILALAVFCAMRKLAFEELYIEVTDRNPLFNDQPDQGAAFAELFALGSRCESYFDMSPSAFGKLMLQRFREQYNNQLRQPPLFKETSMALETAYSEPQMDIASDPTSLKMPAYQHFTFMGVFAIPALIDVLLLTTTKHGLYLSGSMSPEEQIYATIAFMLSLLLSGAIGTWITCGATYYLASMAFSAMHYFIITRLLAGFVFLFSTASIGFIAISCVAGFRPALIFFFYIIVLTTYLSLLSALANYSLNGSSFQSGRLIIVLCVPVLFISPVTTIFIQGYDSQIYLTVLYVVITLLLFGTRHIGSLWTIWFLKIETITDKSLREWYLEREVISGDITHQKLSEPALLKQARQDRLHEIMEALPGFFKFRKTKDPMIRKLAGCYQATSILMDWYSLTSGLPKPFPFSSTWNVQSKVALKQIMESQRGIRFHNGFLHWRQAGDEIGCTVLYFIIALLDKWIALLGGSQSIDGHDRGSDLLGLISTNAEFRYAVGFGLAYYLIGAVLLDYNAQKLHELTAQRTQEIVRDDDCLPRAIKVMARDRTTLYWKTLLRYLCLHIWSFVISSTLMLLFSTSRDAIILFLAYVLSYTGLLFYQYTKIFSGPHALKPLLMGVCLGLPVGFILRTLLPNFLYSDVIALGVGTWTVAILSLWAVQIVGKTLDEPVTLAENAYHAFYDPGPDPAWSQDEIRLNYDLIRSLPNDKHPLLDPESYQGQQMRLILSSASVEELPDIAKHAFPSAARLLESSLRAFNDGKVVVELVSMKHLNAEGHSTRAISYITDDFVRVLVACDAGALSSQQQLSQHCLYNIAEIVLHTVAESFLGYSHSHASLSENLLKSTVDPEMRMSHSFKCQAGCSKVNDAIFSLGPYYKQEILRNLCLGFTPDIKWDSLPEQIRNHLIQRCLGRPSFMAEGQRKYVQTVLNETNFDIYLARCNYGAYMSALFYRDTTVSATVSSLTASASLTHEEFGRDLSSPLSQSRKLSILSIPRRVAGYIWHKIGTMTKFYALAFIADAEYQRELNLSLAKNPKVVREVARIILDGIWVTSKTAQSLLLPCFLFHNRKNVASLWKRIQGREVSFKRKHIDIQTADGQYTAFIHHNGDGSFNLYQYRGEHSSEPESRDKLSYVNTYSEKIQLLRRREFQGGEAINVAEYDYSNTQEGGRKRLPGSKSPSSVLPITRRVIAGRDQFQLINYNRAGLVESGSYIKDGNLIRFLYHYRKVAKLDGELLRAEFVLPYMSCTVSWCAPPPRHAEKLHKWISYSEVTEATFVFGTDVWESKYTYDHKCHPTIATTLNGKPVETPPLIKYDHLDILKKPKIFSFLDDNPLYSFTTVRPNPIGLCLGLYTRRHPFWTSQSRSLLWKAWKDGREYDGVVMRWMDERLLRRDAVLKPYWRKRDWGNLSSAEAYLEQHADSIMAKVDLDMMISSWTPLAIRMNDLLTFGPGGDASARTRSKFISQENEDDSALHVIAIDNGTWPNEGGGVSACRRDVINNLKSIKWHMVVESANDFGIPKHQIEKNVHSLKVIPLWGLDLMTPTHGLFKNRLDSEIKHIPRHADVDDIKMNFVPILAALIHGARSLEFEVGDIKQITRALVNLNAYFAEGSRHWSMVWGSKVVKNAWRRLWLSKLSNNVRPSSAWLDVELPTLGHMDQGLELWSRYLFIFSVPVPEKMPDVFQASHHSASASYGIVCKVKRQCTLQIWDHAISWRETNLNLSSALCTLAPFVRSSLLGLLRMTSVLILHHADTILPCADFFNPNWEIEIGTCQGTLEHRNAFKRKIDPVVNGITDMQQFALVKEIKTKTPTVTMLSHVWFAKDIKTAILAADIIVNEWGFKDYQLDIYGAVDKAPAYSTSCQQIISTKSLGKNVVLRGEANPIDVLEQTWVFLNSSISEGLPLALGEAALTGAPVVCTDVGASQRVLTDPQTNKTYSAIVAPNDARALAKAQIHILAMLGEWYSFADPPAGAQYPQTGSSSSASATSSGSGTPTSRTLEASSSTLGSSTSALVGPTLLALPEKPTKDDVDAITRRMYTQTAARRRLGMRGREIVQKSFSGDRYLREHEQMLWIGKATKDMRHGAAVAASPVCELVPTASVVEKTKAIHRVSEIMARRPVTATTAVSEAVSSLSQVPTVASQSTRVASSRGTDGSGVATSGSTGMTSVWTGGQTVFEKAVVVTRAQWDKPQGKGQGVGPRVREVHIV